MEKRGSGRRPHGDNPAERSGLGTIDVIAIVVVIMLLGGALGALVVHRTAGSGQVTAWAGRAAESLLDWISRIDAPQTTLMSPVAR